MKSIVTLSHLASQRQINEESIKKRRKLDEDLKTKRRELREEFRNVEENNGLSLSLKEVSSFNEIKANFLKNLIFSSNNI